MSNFVGVLISTRGAPQAARDYIEARKKASNLWQGARQETRAGAIDSLQGKTGLSHYNQLDQALHNAKPQFQATIDSGAHLQARQEAFGKLLKLLLTLGVILFAVGVLGASSHGLDPAKLGGAIGSLQSIPLWAPIGLTGVGGFAFVGVLATAKQRSNEKHLLQEIDGHPYPETFTEASVHLWLTGEALPVAKKTSPSSDGHRSWMPPASQPINISH